MPRHGINNQDYYFVRRVRYRPARIPRFSRVRFTFPRLLSRTAAGKKEDQVRIRHSFFLFFFFFGEGEKGKKEGVFFFTSPFSENEERLIVGYISVVGLSYGTVNENNVAEVSY